MKQGIHPNWHQNAQVTCSCGTVFTVGSTLPTIAVDICSNCHPFFTGEVRFVDRQGRVDKFMKKMQTAQSAQTTQPGKKSKKTTDVSESQSYRDILRAQQVELKKAAKTAKTE